MKTLSRGYTYTPCHLNNITSHRLSGNDISLRRIIFPSRNLGNEGVSTLTEALRYNTNLIGLDLRSNNIGVEGVKSLAKLMQIQNQDTMLSSSPTSTLVSSEEESNNHEEQHHSHIDNNVGGIKTLMLCDNNLRNDGVKILSDTLIDNNIIEHLWLDDNCIGVFGLTVLAEALKQNVKLNRLHLRHNAFQSLAPLIQCTFNKQSLETVSTSNHTLKHIFLNCGYSYECTELENIMRINRLGKKEAQRRKIALYIEEDIHRLLERDVETRLLPCVLEMLSQYGSMTTMLKLMQSLPSILFFQGINYENNALVVNEDGEDDPMDVEYLTL